MERASASASGRANNTMWSSARRIVRPRTISDEPSGRTTAPTRMLCGSFRSATTAPSAREPRSTVSSSTSESLSRNVATALVPRDVTEHGVCRCRARTEGGVDAEGPDQREQGQLVENGDGVGTGRGRVGAGQDVGRSPHRWPRSPHPSGRPVPR